jgi:large subunit ribosomal protein L15
MPTLSDLRRPRNSWHRKKRVGRGQGSGLGKTAGRGGKGQKAHKHAAEVFEGSRAHWCGGSCSAHFAQPQFLRVVNVGELERFAAGTSVDEAALRKAGLVKGSWDGIKLLGEGQLTRKVSVQVHRASAKAKELVEKAGGSLELLPLMAHKPEAAARAHAGKGAK